MVGIRIILEITFERGTVTWTVTGFKVLGSESRKFLYRKRRTHRDGHQTKGTVQADQRLASTSGCSTPDINAAVRIRGRST